MRNALAVIELWYSAAVNKRTAHQHDKAIHRATHRLFRQALLTDFWGGLICYATRVPALIIYDVFIPLAIAYGIQAIATKQFDVINTYALWIIALGIAYCILWAVGGVFICRCGIAGTKYIQRTAFANYLHKDYEFYNSTYLGSLGAQLIQLREAYSIYSQLFFLNLPRQLTTIVAGTAFIAFQSWLLAIVTLACMLLVLSFTIATSRWRLRFRRVLSEANSELAGVSGDALGQAMTVKSFATETIEQSRLEKALGKWGKAQYWSWASSIPADDGRMLLSAITTAIILILTANLYRDNAITIAIVALIQLYVIKMITATQDIADSLKSYETAMGGAYKSVETFLVNPTVNDMPNVKKLPRKKQQSIELQNVSFQYGGGKHDPYALQSINLEIKPGERIGIVGYSGSGKTTLTKLLMRFMDVSSGRILIDGIDIRSIAQRQLRQIIAYVPQEPLLFHRSIAENIAYSNINAHQRQIEQAAKAAYVDEFANNLPHGYETIVGERGVKLSGGQRQRVAIARALLKDAPILLLDEATSALDSRSEQYIQKGLWKLMKDRTAIVIAHRLSTIQRLDRIIVMDKGSIVQVGSHNELLEQQGIYANLWTHQSGGYIGASDTGRP